MPKEDDERYRNYFRSMSSTDALEKVLENQKKLVREEVKLRFNWRKDNYEPHLYSSGSTDTANFEMPVDRPGAVYCAYHANCVQSIRINPKEIQKFKITVITKPVDIFMLKKLGNCNFK